MIKSPVKGFLAPRLTRMIRGVAPVRAVILRYHSVHERAPSRFLPGSLSHSKASFEEQMRYVAASFRPLPLSEIVDRLARSEKLPRNTVAVTFDDGYRDNYEVAFPVLQRLGIPATFFVTTGYVGDVDVPWFCRLHRAFHETRVKTLRNIETGRVCPLDDREERREMFLAVSRRCASSAKPLQDEILSKLEESLEVSTGLEHGEKLMMRWDDLGEMIGEGYEIGSHTVSHPNLTLVDDAQELEAQMSVSKKQIEEHLGTVVQHLAYPNPIGQPHWNDRVRGVAMQSGYRSAGTSQSGWVDGGSDLGALRRLACPHDFKAFVWRLEVTSLGRLV